MEYLYGEFVKKLSKMLYIGGGREVIETLSKAKKYSLDVIYIQKEELFKNEVTSYVSEVHFVDYENDSDLFEVADHIYRESKFNFCLSMSEDALLPAAKITERFGLMGNSVSCVEGLKNKELMRRKLEGSQLSPVRFRSGKKLDDILSFLSENNAPIIVKPINGSGSQCIFKIESKEQAERAYQALIVENISNFLLEEFLDGEEYSVESFSYSGKHVILTVTEKFLGQNFVEMGHLVPARIDAITRRNIEANVCDFLTTMNLQHGPAHTELKLTNKGVRIIESHNRPGGDRINELVNLSYGFDMKELNFGWHSNSISPQLASPQPVGSAAILFLSAPEGVVKNVVIPDHILNHKDVVELKVGVKSNQKIFTPRESYDRIGHIIVKGSDPTATLKLCEQTRDQINFQMDNS